MSSAGSYLVAREIQGDDNAGLTLQGSVFTNDSFAPNFLYMEGYGIETSPVDITSGSAVVKYKNNND